MNTRLTVNTAKSIKHDGPVTIADLQNAHIPEIVINAEKHPDTLFSLTILDTCHKLEIDEVIIEGPIGITTKAEWNKRISNGLVDHGTGTLIHKITVRNTHDGIVQRGKGGVIGHFLVDTYSGDAGQTTADECRVQSGLAKCSIETLPYKQKHRDVWQLFTDTDKQLVDVCICNITIEHDPSHPWSAPERLQGVVHTDGTLKNSTIQGCKINGAHPEHGVSLGHCEDVLIIENESDSLIRLGDRKQGLTSTGNVITKNKGTIQLELADATNEEIDNQSYSGECQGAKTMKMSQHGLQILMQSEGFSNDVYIDQAGLPTIGVGHCLTQSEVNSGKIHLNNGELLDLRHGPITDDQVMALLDNDVQPREAAVLKLFTVPLAQHQFDALLHWLFNIGEGAAAKSTLRKKLNKADYDAVPAELKKWTKITVGGKKQVSKGLENRRDIEVALWNGDYFAERGPIQKIDNGMSPTPDYQPPKETIPSVFDLNAYEEKFQQMQQGLQQSVRDNAEQSRVQIEQLQTGLQSSLSDSLKDGLDQVIKRQEAYSANYVGVDSPVYKQAYDDVIGQNSKSPAQSKILVIAVSSLVAYVSVKFGLNLTPETASTLEDIIVMAGMSGIGVARVWFTTKVLK